MASKIKVVLNTDRLDKLPAQAQANAERILDQYALTAEGKAKAAAPVDTGFLKNSISVARKTLQRIINVGAQYAIHVEYGTVRSAAQPFLTPAIEAIRRPLQNAWKGLIKK